MISTIKGKIIFFVTVVMIVCAIVNIFFTNRDVGNSMHVVQEKSASNILQSLDLVIRDDYHKLLSDKISMTLLKKEQLNNAGHLIESVFHGFFASQQKGLLHEKAVSNALEWLSSAPFKLDYYIISNDYQVMQSSNPHISNENYKALTDIKQRNISEIMSNSNLSKRGDFASFIIEGENRTGRSVLAYFLPFPQWGLTIVTSIDISDIEAEALVKQNKMIKSLTEYSEQLNITENGFVYIFDLDGNPIIPSSVKGWSNIAQSTNLLTKNLVHDDIKSVSRDEIPKFTVVSSSDTNQQSMVVYCSFFKSLGWYISIFIPIDEITKPARDLAIRQILIITIVFMAGLVAVFIIVTRVATPLNLLSSYAKELPNLDFTKPLTPETKIDSLPLKYNDEVGNLASSFILMRQQLSTNILELISVTTSRERIESELNIAREIQLGLVPKTFPAFPNCNELDLFATLKPAKEIGGDLYDFFFIDEDQLCFALGDVADKGIPSALFMVVTMTLIRTLAERTNSPSEVMHNINNTLSVDNPRAMFVTLIIGVLNIKTGEITYANGGHNPPVLIPKSGEAYFKEDFNEPLVGAIPDIQYSDHVLKLAPGESFLLYTDGVNEAMNPNDEQYSNDTFLAHVAAHHDKRPNEMIELILNHVEEHAGTAPQSDDIAMLMVKYKGEKNEV